MPRTTGSPMVPTDSALRSSAELGAVAVEVRPGGYRDAREYAWRANITHGLARGDLGRHAHP